MAAQDNRHAPNGHCPDENGDGLQPGYETVTAFELSQQNERIKPVEYQK
jgi:hypothetical protein